MVGYDLIWHKRPDFVSSPIQQKVLNSLFKAIRPLAQALISAGIGYREFSEVAKAAFVDVAAAKYGIRGRPTNSSRIAVITGLSRKEVARIRDSSIDESFRVPFRESAASVILHHWNNDPDYLGHDRKPRTLPYRGHPVSFESLVSKYAGDIPAGALRAELRRVGAIEETASGMIVKKPYFVPNRIDGRLVIGLEDVLASAIETLAYNCDPNRSGEPWFQRVASVGYIDPKFYKEIEQHTREKLTEIGLAYCSYLDEYEKASKDSQSNNDQSKGMEVGIGLYYYQRDAE